MLKFNWLDSDGCTTFLRDEMSRRNNILIGWPQEVQDKYEYLWSCLPTVSESEDDPDQKGTSKRDVGWNTDGEETANDKLSASERYHIARDNVVDGSRP